MLAGRIKKEFRHDGNGNPTRRGPAPVKKFEAKRKDAARSPTHRCVQSF